MPIWNPQCGGEDHESVHQTYIHHLTALMEPVLPALAAPCDAWSLVLGGLLGTVIKRLENHASVLGRRTKAAAAQLDALGPPPGLAVTEDTTAAPPLIQLETGGGDIGPAAIMAVQEAPDDGAVAARGPTPVEPEHWAGFYFAEVRPSWHQQAVAWAGDYLPNLRGYASLDDFLASRQSEPIPDPPADPSIPDIY